MPSATLQENIMIIYATGEHFEVICKECKSRFTVIRNWSGGIRRRDNENSNPAKCHCGSRQLEVYQKGDQHDN